MIPAEPLSSGYAWAITGLGWIIWLAIYAWSALCLHILANKTGTPYPWLAWIPIANAYLMCKVAGHSGWWIFIFLVPLVNIVVLAIFWTDIARNVRMPAWLGILIIIPLVNYIIMGVLAFAGQSSTAEIGGTP